MRREISRAVSQIGSPNCALNHWRLQSFIVVDRYRRWEHGDSRQYDQLGCREEKPTLLQHTGHSKMIIST
jgi:hypothetical protein